MVALTIVSSAMGTEAYLSAKEGENLQCVINASREEYALDDSIEEADAVAEIQINGVIGEFDNGIPQTLHKASVIETYKGELPGEINVLQDGTKQMPVSDSPLFKEGERYILVMKKTVSLEDNDNAYWILKEYFVSGNQAVKTLPTGELAADEAGIDTYDSAENWNRAVSRKEAELPYDSEILEKSDLVDYIEGGNKMVKMVKRIVSWCLVLCLLVALSGTTVFATMVAYGSEKAGYMVGTHQLRKKTNTFDDSTLDKKYKSYMTYGAKVWKDSGVVTLKRNKSSVNKVTTYQSKDTTILAYAQCTPDYQTGKIIRFTIKFNTLNMADKTTAINKSVAAHEIGHTFGLSDLYEKRNEDKVMYGIINKDNARPTEKDIKGGKYATRK